MSVLMRRSVDCPKLRCRFCHGLLVRGYCMPAQSNHLAETKERSVQAMPQGWYWILIIAVLVICCGGMIFGMGRKGRMNGLQNHQTPNVERDDRTSREDRVARR